jgi:two-component system KDP operon response regulator KdpE
VVIEDEKGIRRFLQAGMPSEDFEWNESECGEDGIRKVANVNPDVVLLDLGLPDIDGLTVISRLREWTQVPIIVLTARGRDQDKVAALDAGADDYLTKPFSLAELSARIRVSLRHSKKGAEAQPIYDSGGLLIDFGRRSVAVDGREVRLTPTEYSVLCALAKHPGRVLTHAQLLDAVWGPGNIESTHTIRVHMAGIRQKIESDPSHPRFIRTETGVGYRLMGA